MEQKGRPDLVAAKAHTGFNVGDKRIMKKTAVAALFLVGAVGSAQAFDGDPRAGEGKSATCVACHQADGNSTNAEYPKLAGLGAGYIYKQLKEFKSGEREDAVMAGMVAGLSDQDMRDLAAFYSDQTMSGGTANEELVALGEQIFRAGNKATGVSACMACHGPAGGGNVPANFPRLAGQHAEYVERELGLFAAGDRANDPGQMMRNIAGRMSEEEIEAVSSYIEGLTR